jgi:predicted enzyme related to lactoylglutathione lyase
LERAKTFYETVLDIKLEEHDMGDFKMLWFPMVPEAKGAQGFLVMGKDYKPTPDGVIVYFTCPDIDGALQRAEGVGGKVIFPKKDIGEYGFIAWLLDSEGNRIALHSVK